MHSLNGIAGATLPHVDYAGAVSTQRGRCFRFITNRDGKPENCPAPLVATGWLQVGPKWYQVDSCAQHSAELQRRGPYRAAQGRQVHAERQLGR